MNRVDHICVHAPICDSTLNRLKRIESVRLTQVSVADADEEAPWELPDEIAPDVRIIYSMTAPSNLDAAQSLRLLHIRSVGYSTLYGLGLPERNVRVCNAAGVFDVPIAEWNVAMMINLARDFRQIVRNQEAAIWDRPARFQREICNSTVGLWGYGGIGRETARLCKALGMTVHVLTRNPIGRRDTKYVVTGKGDPEGNLPDRRYSLRQKDDFLSGLDFLIVAMPLTAQTESLIGAAELRALPPHAFLLNPARGPIVAETALLHALQENWIAGAALDTHYQYPMPAEHPLWKFPNVIMTPHISGSTETQTYNTRIDEIFAMNVERFLANQPLLNEVSERQLSNLE